ncbi:MAG: Lrp/AsnC family transcriptional regulator [Dehalococcoidia bacterium]
MKEIFEILEQNGRAAPEQISTMVDKPVREVEKIIKQAEKDGSILKYKTIINWPKLGKEDVALYQMLWKQLRHGTKPQEHFSPVGLGISQAIRNAFRHFDLGITAWPLFRL